MNKVWKYGVVPGVICVFLLGLTLLLLPVLIDVQQFVPGLEKRISKAAGRPFSLGREVSVSFFPWLSLSFSEMQLGNPPGFAGEALVRIESCEARVKLLPLLKKKIEISRLVMGGLEVNLEKNKDGKVNWGLLRSLPRLDFLQDHVLFALLAVTDGRVNIIDREKAVRHTLADLMLLSNNMQEDRAVALELRGRFDGMPLELEGQIGPFRRQQDHEALPVDLGFRLVEMLQGQVRGTVEKRQSALDYEVALSLSPFSPRDLFAALELPLPVAGAEPTAFGSAEMALAVKGKGDSLTLGQGTVRFDDTRMLFSGEIKNLKRPEITFSLDLDRLDLDRYFPPRLREKEAPVPASGEVAAGDGAVGMISGLAGRTDLAGVVNIQALTLRGAEGSGIRAELRGKDGILTFDKAAMDFSGGQVQASLAADLSGEVPALRLAAQSQGVGLEALGRAMGGRNLPTGSLTGELALEFSGATAADMGGSVKGTATFAVHGGSIPGIDLSGSIARGKAVDGQAASDSSALRTEFSELQGEVDVENGILNLRQALLESPAMAMALEGRADLVSGGWELQAAPRGMAAKKTGKKAKSPSVLRIAGTFAEPAAPEDRKDPAGGAGDGIKLKAAGLVAANLPREGSEKPRPPGSGKIRINPLREQTSL